MSILGKQYWYLSKHQIRKFDRFFAILSKWTMISGKVCRHISASGYQENDKLVYQTPKMHRNQDYKHGPHSGRPNVNSFISVEIYR